MWRTTIRQDLVTIGLALWTMVGLLVDVYFHSTDPSLESFWTPWHALFYSGFTATAAWIAWLCGSAPRSRAADVVGPQGRTKEPLGLIKRLADRAPVGYRAAIFGVAIFAIGGIGDAIWHTIFGVETSIDALLSPTHLLLFVGLVAIVSAPLRAAWTADLGAAPSWRKLGPSLLSVTFATALVAIMFVYTWGPVQTWSPRQRYWAGDPGSERIAEEIVVAAVISSLVLFVPLIVLARRWRLPFGAATLVLGLVHVFIAVGFNEELLALPAILAGGVVFDVLQSAKVDRRVLAFAPVAVLWAAFFALIALTDTGLRTAPEIWSGTIIMSGLAVLAVELLFGLVVSAARPNPAVPEEHAAIERSERSPA